MRKLIITIALTIPFILNVLGQEKKTVSTKAIAQDKATVASILRGKSVYTQYCLPCHQADGGGVQSLNPPLIRTEYVLGDKTRLINILLKGFNQDIEIDGEVYSNPMPALNSLSDQQIADVLTYVRNNFENKASAVTAGEVKVVRGKK